MLVMKALVYFFILYKLHKMAGNFIFNKKIMSVEPIVIISTYPSHMRLLNPSLLILWPSLGLKIQVPVFTKNYEIG